MVSVPMVEGGNAFDKLAASVCNPVGIVIAHQPPTIWRMKGQGIGDAVGFLRRHGDLFDLEPRYVTAVVDDLLAIEVEQIGKGLISSEQL